MTKERIRVILLNGFRYQGTDKSKDSTFVAILDDKDKQLRKFPISSISVIEYLEEL